MPKPNIAAKIKHDGIYLINHDKTNTRIAKPIRVIAFGTKAKGTPREQAFTYLKFVNRRNKWKRELVPSSMLITGATELTALLASRGYSWPANRNLRSAIIAVLSEKVPRRDIVVTDVPGWHGKYFVLPGENYTRAGPDSRAIYISYNPGVKLGAFERRGTLDAWKTHIAKACTYSSRAQLAVASVFAAPNLRPLKVNSFGLNFSGITSGGKTFLVRLAAATAGLNSEEGPDTWDGSAPAFEQRALGHRDNIVPFDDVSHLAEQGAKVLVKLVTFRLASNRAKAKAGQYVEAHKLADTEYRVIMLSTSEDPLWDQIQEGDVVRGEEVRMINMRACVSDLDDIFDCPNAAEHVGKSVDERREFVERLERLAVRHQGVAYRAYLAKRLMDKEANVTLKGYVEEYCEAAPISEQLRWLGRIRRYFAVVYASAALAIDYGVLPWTKKSTLSAIKLCMLDAMAQLTNEVAPVV